MDTLLAVAELKLQQEFGSETASAPPAPESFHAPGPQLDNLHDEYVKYRVKRNQKDCSNRAELNKRFAELKAKLPEHVQTSKPSKSANILHGAVKYIQELEDNEEEHKHDLEWLNQKITELEKNISTYKHIDFNEKTVNNNENMDVDITTLTRGVTTHCTSYLSSSSNSTTTTSSINNSDLQPVHKLDLKEIIRNDHCYDEKNVLLKTSSSSSNSTTTSSINNSDLQKENESPRNSAEDHRQKKRRAELKKNFGILKTKLPNLEDTSDHSILLRTIEYIQELEEKADENTLVKDRLNQKITELEKNISTYKHIDFNELTVNNNESMDVDITTLTRGVTTHCTSNLSLSSNSTTTTSSINNSDLQPVHKLDLKEIIRNDHCYDEKNVLLKTGD